MFAGGDSPQPKGLGLWCHFAETRSYRKEMLQRWRNVLNAISTELFRDLAGKPPTTHIHNTMFGYAVKATNKIYYEEQQVTTFLEMCCATFPIAATEWKAEQNPQYTKRK